MQRHFIYTILLIEYSVKGMTVMKSTQYQNSTLREDTTHHILALTSPEYLD